MRERGEGEGNLAYKCWYTWHCMYVCSIYNCPLPTDTSFVRTRNESIDTAFNPKPYQPPKASPTPMPSASWLPWQQPMPHPPQELSLEKRDEGVRWRGESLRGETAGSLWVEAAWRRLGGTARSQGGRWPWPPSMRRGRKPLTSVEVRWALATFSGFSGHVSLVPMKAFHKTQNIVLQKAWARC